MFRIIQFLCMQVRNTQYTGSLVTVLFSNSEGNGIFVKKEVHSSGPPSMQHTPYK